VQNESQSGLNEVEIYRRNGRSSGVFERWTSMDGRTSIEALWPIQAILEALPEVEVNFASQRMPGKLPCARVIGHARTGTSFTNADLEI